MTEMKAGLGDIVSAYPWTIAFAFFAVSVLINSQGAVVVAMLPLAYSLGLPGPVLLGLLPSVYGYFFIPNYPSDIATVNFDRSGTTVIGPGVCLLWQNLFNSWQIWNHNKQLSKTARS